jgi:hypothetical protein
LTTWWWRAAAVVVHLMRLLEVVLEDLEQELVFL